MSLLLLHAVQFALASSRLLPSPSQTTIVCLYLPPPHPGNYCEFPEWKRNEFVKDVIAVGLDWKCRLFEPAATPFVEAEKSSTIHWIRTFPSSFKHHDSNELRQSDTATPFPISPLNSSSSCRHRYTPNSHVSLVVGPADFVRPGIDIKIIQLRFIFFIQVGGFLLRRFHHRRWPMPCLRVPVTYE